MPIDLFLALTFFAVAMAFTPGSNNIMLTASGVNFGFQRSIPHMSGVTIGFLVRLAACAGGLGLAFSAVPALQLALKIAGGVYMLWLAWKVTNAHHADAAGDAMARPFTFFQAAAFQWVNPKAAHGVVRASHLKPWALSAVPGRPRSRAGIQGLFRGSSCVSTTIATPT